MDGLKDGTTPNQNVEIYRVYDQTPTWEWRAPGAFYSIIGYEGLPTSSPECGGFSFYRVRWSVQRTSFQP